MYTYEKASVKAFEKSLVCRVRRMHRSLYIYIYEWQSVAAVILIVSLARDLKFANESLTVLMVVCTRYRYMKVIDEIVTDKIEAGF